MTKILKNSALVILSASTLGCQNTKNIKAQKEICTMHWYSIVQKQIQTSDSSGHGPDLGSDEWKGVVEFKLGIRGKPDIPAKNTQEWCEYIDMHYIK